MRKITLPTILLSTIAFGSTTPVLAQTERTQAEYFACIQRCVSAAQTYGYGPSPYWAGFNACQAACEEYNPETPPSNDPPPGKQCTSPSNCPIASSVKGRSDLASVERITL
ncbi:MAG: hypothetical protein K2Y20_03090 [Sphingomonas sp.]|nr:hypothetical protein [Sphingomonas sp.]